MAKLDDLTIRIMVSTEDIEEIIDRAVDRAIEKFEKKREKRQINIKLEGSTHILGLL